MNRFQKIVVVLATATAVATTIGGCTTGVDEEEPTSTSAERLVVVKASPRTTAATGVDTWRVQRGGGNVTTARVFGSVPGGKTLRIEIERVADDEIIVKVGTSGRALHVSTTAGLKANALTPQEIDAYKNMIRDVVAASPVEASSGQDASGEAAKPQGFLSWVRCTNELRKAMDDDCYGCGALPVVGGVILYASATLCAIF